MERLFMKGMTWGWNSKRGDYYAPGGLDSLRKLKEQGCDWVCLAFYTYQDSIYSTEIVYDYAFNIPDREIEYVIVEAKKLGLKVCLKPVVNSRDGLWRAYIGFPDEETPTHRYWDNWFGSYSAFLAHYAEIAERLECEMFCVGCEMIKTEGQSRRWRDTIAKVRDIYSGPLIYNANHGKEDGVEWFDALDVIGTSAYYPVGSKPDDSEQAMIANWLPVRDSLERLHKRFNKPVAFAEIGCRSALGCATMPWDYKHFELPFNEDEQANFYSSALQVFWNEPWFAGFFWWDWSVSLYPLEKAKENCGFDVYGKKAGDILQRWYTMK